MHGPWSHTIRVYIRTSVYAMSRPHLVGRAETIFFLNSQQRKHPLPWFSEKVRAHLVGAPFSLPLARLYCFRKRATSLHNMRVDTRISSLFVFSVFIAQSIRVRRDAHAFSFSLSRFRSLKGKERRGAKEGVLRSGRVATYKSNQRSGSVCLFQFVMSLSVYVSVCCRGFRASYTTVVSASL